MAIIRFNPFGRSFFSPFGFEDEDLWPNYTATEGLNIYEEDNKVFVEAPVPGIPTDKIDINYEDGMLHIAGRAEVNKEEIEKKRVVHRMQKISSFDYRTVLPRPIDVGSLNAEVEDGVVRVSANIAEEAKPKKITVKAKSSK